MGLERLVFFSDAVFAIAITLLVIETRLPEPGEIRTSRDLLSALWSLLPEYVGFVVSFVVIGSFWMSHHAMFRSVRGYDGALVVLNMVFLLFVAFMPFPTSLVGRFSAIPAAEAFYAAWVGLAGLAKLALWAHAARRHGLLDPSMTPRELRHSTLTMAIPGVVFLISVPLAWVHALAPVAAWIAAPAARLAFGIRRRRPDSRDRVAEGRARESQARPVRAKGRKPADAGGFERED